MHDSIPRNDKLGDEAVGLRRVGKAGELKGQGTDGARVGVGVGRAFEVDVPLPTLLWCGWHFDVDDQHDREDGNHQQEHVEGQTAVRLALITVVNKLGKVGVFLLLGHKLYQTKRVIKAMADVRQPSS